MPTEQLTQELSKSVEAKLTEPRQKIPLSKEIYTAIFKEGPISREFRFYAPAADMSIEDKDKRERERSARIWRLCDRYVKYLRSKENRKLVFVGVPQPFVIDLEAQMKDFVARNFEED